MSQADFTPEVLDRGARLVFESGRPIAHVARDPGLPSETPRKADDDLVFAHPETGRPLDRSKVRKRFKAAFKRAGVRDVRFHDLRHTLRSRVAASGDGGGVAGLRLSLSTTRLN